MQISTQETQIAALAIVSTLTKFISASKLFFRTTVTKNKHFSRSVSKFNTFRAWFFFHFSVLFRTHGTPGMETYSFTPICSYITNLWTYFENEWINSDANWHKSCMGKGMKLQQWS